MAAHVTMPSEVLEELDLSQGPLGQDLLAEDIGDLLDSNTLLGLVVDGSATDDISPRNVQNGVDRSLRMNSPDDTVCSLAQFLGNGVPLVHDKVLVEHLEDFTAL